MLAEYYGPNWQSDTSAKVILVCHSMAATSARYAITQDPSLASHIKEIVTIGGVHKPLTFMDCPAGEFWLACRLYWLPIEATFDGIYWGLSELRLIGTLNKIWTVLSALGANAVGSVIFHSLLNKYTDGGYDLGHTKVFSYLNSASSLHQQRVVTFSYRNLNKFLYENNEVFHYDRKNRTRYSGQEGKIS